MISVSALRPFSFLIGIVSAAAAAAAYFGLPYQYTVWELQVDVRLVILAAALLWLRRKGSFAPDLSTCGVTGWRLKEAILWFLVPAALLLVSALIGTASGSVSFKTLDNPETLFLGALFDIPAVYVFSAFTLLVEEAIFRSLLYRSEMQHRTPWRALVLTSFLWSMYNLPEITSAEGIPLLSAVAAVVYFFLSAMFWTALTNSYRSIWFSYSFRIGLVVFNPILLTSMFFENDAFFETQNILFQSEGVTISFLLLMLSAIFLRKRAFSKCLK